MNKISKAREITEKFQSLVEMANLRSKDTGLSDDNYIIYISTHQGSHGARVKVFKKPQLGNKAPHVAISIEQDPKIVAEKGLILPTQIRREVLYWVSINNVILMKLWNARASHVLIGDYLDQLEKTKAI